MIPIGPKFFVSSDEKKTKEKMGRQKREKGKDAEHSLTAVKKTDWQSDQKDRFFALKFCQLSYALAHVSIFILLYFIYFLTEDRSSEVMSCEHSAIFFSNLHIRQNYSA